MNEYQLTGVLLVVAGCASVAIVSMMVTLNDMAADLKEIKRLLEGRQR